MISLTIFNSYVYKKFLNFLYRKVRILSYIFSLIFIVLGGVFIYFEYNGYIYLICGVCLPLFIYIFLKFIELDNIKNNKLLKYETTQKYTFLDNKLELEQTSIMGIYKDNYYYDEFYRVVKTKEYYYFFINRSQALIVDIKEFNDNEDKKLDDILNEEIKDKFINKKRK